MDASRLSRVDNPIATPHGPEGPAASRAQTSRRKLRGLLPMSIADGYLWSQTVEGTLRGIGWFAGLLMAFAIITAVKKWVDQSVTPWGMVQLVVYQFPRLLLFTLPMSVLYGSVQAFADLSSHGEATAFGAGAMSLPRMMRAPFLWGVFLTVLAFFLQEYVVPGAEQARNAALTKQILTMQGVQTDFSYEKSQPDGGKITINASQLNVQAHTLIAPVFKQLNRDGSVKMQIQARKAIWRPEKGYLKFFEGRTDVFPDRTHSNTPFTISNTWDEFEPAYTPDATALNKGAKTMAQNLEARNFEMVSMSELGHYRDQLGAQLNSASGDARQKIEAKRRGATFGLHDKIATPLICCILVLVGAPLGLRPQRSSGNFAMGLSLGVLLCYYVGWTWASSIGKEGIGNPILLAYFAPAATLAAALILIRKKAF